MDDTQKLWLVEVKKKKTKTMVIKKIEKEKALPLLSEGFYF